MIFEAEFRSFLLAQPAIADLVAARIFGGVREPGSKLPSVVIQRASSTRASTFCGTEPLVDAHIRVDSYGINGDGAWALAKSLRETLVDFGGAMGAAAVEKVFLANEFLLTDPDPGIIRVVQIYNVWYLED
jgi:uncharacterized protein DUF3168